MKLGTNIRFGLSLQFSPKLPPRGPRSQRVVAETTKDTKSNLIQRLVCACTSRANSCLVLTISRIVKKVDTQFLATGVRIGELTPPFRSLDSKNNISSIICAKVLILLCGEP